MTGVPSKKTQLFLLDLHYSAKLSYAEMAAELGGAASRASLCDIARGKRKSISPHIAEAVERLHSAAMGPLNGREDALMKKVGDLKSKRSYAVLAYCRGGWKVTDVVGSLEKAKSCLCMRLREIQENEKGEEIDAFIFRQTSD